MSCAIVTGSGGLIGSEAVLFLASKGLEVFGIDNNLRSYFFGPEASTRWRVEELKKACGNYHHHDIDIRHQDALERLFAEVGARTTIVIHAAAQPSHDWAMREPHTDFAVNAVGTLNVLEAVRKHAPDAAFIFLSTNKVYGDTPNRLPLIEKETRYEISETHPYHASGIDETMTVDQSMHSIFGASKLAADVMVQEYGRYFGLKTCCFRGGCLTGSGHSGAQLHGFLAYLMKCTITGAKYEVFGYKGKQVRDNIHAHDLVNAIWSFAQAPRPGSVYNIGGGRDANCSMLEAIALCEEVSGKRLDWAYKPENRAGDHIWWISDTTRFKRDYPDWRLTYNIRDIIEDIHEKGRLRWSPAQS